MPDYLAEVEEQLVALTEQGRHNRRHRGLDAVLLAVPVLIVAAVVAAVAGIGGGARHNVTPGHRAVVQHGSHRGKPAQAVTGNTVTPPPGPRPPAGGPVPAGFGPESFTAIGEYSWWLLGTAPCASPPCTSIVRTVDGGRSFVGIPAPRTDGVSQLRFANSLDGFADGPQLWVTHDGGAHWVRIRLGGTVTDLEASDGWVYAIVQVGRTKARLWRSPANVDRWSVLTRAGNPLGGLWAQGHAVLLENGPQPGAADKLIASADRGAGFSAHPAPHGLSCQFESPAPPVVWAQCAMGLLGGTWRSTDGGRTFLPTRGTGGRPLPNAAVIAAASGDTAVVGYQKLYRTTDGGASWSPVSGPSGISWWQYLGFTDPTHGVALGYTGPANPADARLYYTTDAGASYHLVRIG